MNPSVNVKKSKRRNVQTSVGRLLALSLSVIIWASSQVLMAAEPTDAAGRIAIRAGKILTMDAEDTVINNGIVLLRDGSIERIGKCRDVVIPAGYRVIDATDKWVVPGLVNAHNHSAGSLMDLNDMVYLTNLGLRTWDTVTPDSELNKLARAGGVTTVLQIPGSGTNMAGFGVITKTAGRTQEEAVQRPIGCLKVAQAGNPEWYWFGVGRTYMNYNARQTMQKARDYHDAWTEYERTGKGKPPEYSPMFDDFRGLFRHEFPTLVHTQIYQVVMATLGMYARDFNVNPILGHSTFDAYKLAANAAAVDVYTTNGPRQFFFDRTQRKMYGNAARWWQGGMKKLGINTDAPVVPERELSYQATMACWYGWEPYPALVGLTRIPAETLMMDGQVGTLEAGKDADVGIWTGDPLDPRSACEMTIVDGRIVYDASVRRRF